MSGEFLRTFIAVDIPEGEVKDNILLFQRTIAGTGADLKPVEPENIHITLRFLGDVSRTRAEDLKDELGGIEFQPFKVAFKGVGVFPDFKRINVVWVGIEEGNVELVDLCGKINRSLARHGIPTDKRGFQPHLTIARVRTSRNREALSTAVMDLAEQNFGGFNVESFCLKQSTLTQKGPIYNTLIEVKAG